MAGRVAKTWKGLLISAASKIVNSGGDTTHPLLNLWHAWNLSDGSPSPCCIRILMPTWNIRMAFIICGGTLNQASTSRKGVQSTESHAFCKSMKLVSGGILLLYPYSRSWRITNIASVADHWRGSPHSFLREHSCLLVRNTEPAGEILRSSPPCATREMPL